LLVVPVVPPVEPVKPPESVVVVPPVEPVPVESPGSVLLPLPLESLSPSKWPLITLGATEVTASKRPTPTAMALKAENPSLTVLPPQTKSAAR
jgi:hypothetical protein